MQALITTVSGIRPLGDNLSVVTVGEHQVVANRKADGSFRWEVGEIVVYVPEGMIVPDDVMKERGYWDDEKQRGLLEGKKHNLVKMRRFGPEEDRVESRGLLFKTPLGSFMGQTFVFVDRENHPEGGEDGTGGKLSQAVSLGDDVTAFFGLTERVPGK